MKRHSARAIATAILVAAFTCSSQRVNADPVVAFSTFGPDGSFDEFAGVFVDGSDTFQAIHFVPAASGLLDRVVVPIEGLSNVQQRVQFDIYTGSATSFETRLESWIVPNPPGITVVPLESLLRPALMAGSDYWLRFSEPDPADLFGSFWHMNDQRIYGTQIFRTEFGSGFYPLTTIPAFSVSVVNAAPVPEPSSMLLVGTGAAAVAGGIRRRHRRRAVC